jgi:acetyl esterase/lipase
MTYGRDTTGSSLNLSINYVYNHTIQSFIHSFAYAAINPQTIILTGDSAGANLALAVTLRAIHSNVRIPDGIMLGYPRISIFFKSIFNFYSIPA